MFDFPLTLLAYLKSSEQMTKQILLVVPRVKCSEALALLALQTGVC